MEQDVFLRKIVKCVLLTFYYKMINCYLTSTKQYFCCMFDATTWTNVCIKRWHWSPRADVWIANYKKGGG